MNTKVKFTITIFFTIMINHKAYSSPIQNDIQYNKYQHQVMERKFQDISDEISSNYAPMKYKNDLFDFDFILLHNMDRKEVLDVMRKADIYLDQIIRLSQNRVLQPHRVKFSVQQFHG